MNAALLVSNILLWVLLIAMAAMLFAFARQIGVLYERVAPAGALMLNRKLRVGMAAPRLAVRTLDGRSLEIGGEDARGRSRLLFFLSPQCPLCKSILPAVLSAARAERDWLELVLAGDGDPLEHRALALEHGLVAQTYVLSEALGVGYGVGKLPYAVLLDATGRVASMGIVNSREHLDSLFEAKERQVGSIQEYVAKRGTDGALQDELTGIQTNQS